MNISKRVEQCVLDLQKNRITDIHSFVDLNALLGKLQTCPANVYELIEMSMDLSTSMYALSYSLISLLTLS